MAKLNRGFTFNDTDFDLRQVTAARLHKLIEDATFSPGAVEAVDIKDGAITSDKLSSSLSGSKLANSSTPVTKLVPGVSGSLLATLSGGSWGEIPGGTSGLPLVAKGATTPPAYEKLGASGIADNAISGHDPKVEPVKEDSILLHSSADGANREVVLSDFLKFAQGLDAAGSGEISAADLFIVLVGGVPKVIPKSQLQNAIAPTSNPKFYVSLYLPAANKQACNCFSLTEAAHVVTTMTALTDEFPTASTSSRKSLSVAPFNGKITRISATHIDDSNTVGGTLSVVKAGGNPYSDGSGNTALGALALGTLSPLQSATQAISASNTFTKGDLMFLFADTSDSGELRIDLEYEITA